MRVADVRRLPAGPRARAGGRLRSASGVIADAATRRTRKRRCADVEVLGVATLGCACRISAVVDHPPLGREGGGGSGPARLGEPIQPLRLRTLLPWSGACRAWRRHRL